MWRNVTSEHSSDFGLELLSRNDRFYGAAEIPRGLVASIPGSLLGIGESYKPASMIARDYLFHTGSIVSRKQNLHTLVPPACYEYNDRHVQGRIPRGAVKFLFMEPLQMSLAWEKEIIQIYFRVWNFMAVDYSGKLY